MEIRIEEVVLHYHKSGNGHPLLLLHGNGEDHHIFDALAAKLENHFTVYAIDSRNHGKSSRTEEFGYDVMAKDMELLVRRLGLEHVSIVGFSDGAIIALLMAMQEEPVLEKMVLLGANLKPSDFKDRVYRHLEKSYEENPDQLVALMLHEPNIEAEDLEIINIPTLVVGGEHDIYKPDTFDKISGHIKGSQLVIMEGHDHSSYVAETDILFPVIKEFLLP